MLEHCRGSTDTSKFPGSQQEAPTLAGDGSWGDQVRWRTAEGALISPTEMKSV